MSNYVTSIATNYGGPYCNSPTFGAPTCLITTQYKAGAIIFGATVPGQATFGAATTTEGPLTSWAGVSATNNVDLLTPVNVQVVLPGTTNQATTGYIAVEAGFAASGNLLLSVYDISGSLIATRANGLDFIGPHGRSLMVLGVPPIGSPFGGQVNAPFSGPLSGIAFFIITTPGIDTFAVNQIWVGDTIGSVVLPYAHTRGARARA